MIKLAKFSYNAKVFDGSPLYASSIATKVTVIDKATSTPATIWEDFDGLTLKSNPFNIDEAGIIQFYADAGRYDITAVNGPNSDTVPDYILGESGGGSSASWGSITGTLSDQADLQAELDGKQGKTFTTLELTGDLTLLSSHVGQILYTLVGTSADVDISVPAGLGDGFHCTFIHRGTGSFNIVPAGAKVNPQAGGTLELPQDGRASIIESGGADIFDCVGIVVSA